MKLTEVDLIKIRTALEKETLSEALEAMEKVLKEINNRDKFMREKPRPVRVK